MKLNELHSLYVELLKNLGIRKTIKKKNNFPTVHEHSHGQNIVFVFEEGMNEKHVK